MPELPEVETIARGLQRKVAGDVIESVWIGSKPEPLKSTAREIARTLGGARIRAVRRAGKHLVFDLERGDRPAQWIVHLGMTGRMQLGHHNDKPEKHTHAIAVLRSGRELRFVDPRRFGRLEVRRTRLFEAPGLEPLEAAFADFAPLFRGRRTPIKSALLNQKLLAGIGNIYADEALFRARIRPRRRAARLTTANLAMLHAALREVLREAIQAGGSSISDYLDADGNAGFFQMAHRVYGREALPCLDCGTPIKRSVIAGRSSHWCPSCQK
ncbi:MAG: bifunctional DNA-formamidopyrimidine glycosylase/DNA-(apurinic or apyrimidinic site) lyase [Acidobacteria bacterium]|nr:bifunctional DNA-formamidopyrimidine glycosylase/DNA-(apurinic or apyrimidinic site) lyase [Acidobacteriota bacterium]